MAEFIRLDPADNVITATQSLEAGVEIEKVVTAGLIPRHHKIAAEAIALVFMSGTLPSYVIFISVIGSFVN